MNKHTESKNVNIFKVWESINVFFFLFFFSHKNMLVARDCCISHFGFVLILLHFQLLAFN